LRQGKYILDIFVAVLSMFFFSILYLGLKQDALTNTIISSDTKAFVDSIRSKGYLTKEMYEIFLDEISDTNVLYDLSLEHKQVVFEPEYRLKTAEEIINEQNAAYNGTNAYHYFPVSTQIPTVVDPIDNSGLVMNTETNESVMAAAVSTPALPSHVHTAACYTGHIHTGSSTAGGGCYTVPIYHTHNSTCYHEYPYTHTHTSSCVTLAPCGGTLSVVYAGVNTYKDSHCNGNTLSVTVGQYVCNKCGYSDTIGVVISQSCTCGWSSVGYTPSKICNEPYLKYVCGMQEGVTYYGSLLVCGKTQGVSIEGYNLGCGQEADIIPDCGQLVSSISPTHPVQTVYLNDPLITTVVITHLDGSTETKIGTTTFSTSVAVQNQVVTISYTSTAGGVTTTKTCTISVTVVPKTKTCSNGHTYNLNNDGSDPGCIYCRSWLRTLALQSPSSGTITIYRGTSLQTNGVSLLATYLDGHTEIVTNQYVDNLDNDYIGTQTATISYKGKNTTILVTVKRNIVRCPVCERYYELYPDDTNPGCPYCASLTPVFTGDVLEYYEVYYNKEITDKLFNGSGVYYFSKDDYIDVAVKNKRKSWGTKVASVIFPNLPEISIFSEYGGYIRENGK
jgi:hypothetical protein